MGKKKPPIGMYHPRLPKKPKPPPKQKKGWLKPKGGWS